MRILLDSVILIDHFNGINKASRYIEEHAKNSVISVITRAEVLVGFDDKSATMAKQLLDYFQAIPITKEDADLAAELRRAYRWKLPDALQIAISKNHKLKFATRNTKDFNSAQHSFILFPYQI